MKLIVDFLGVCAEVFMLYYLYDNTLQRKPQASRHKTLTVYITIGLLFMLISTFVGQPRIRTLIYLLTSLLPLILYQNAITIKLTVAPSWNRNDHQSHVFNDIPLKPKF